jgi:hypothetical protein
MFSFLCGMPGMCIYVEKAAVIRDFGIRVLDLGVHPAYMWLTQMAKKQLPAVDNGINYHSIAGLLF